MDRGDAAILGQWQQCALGFAVLDVVAELYKIQWLTAHDFHELLVIAAVGMHYACIAFWVLA